MAPEGLALECAVLALSRSYWQGVAEAKEEGKGRREERSGQERIGCGFNTGIDISLSSGVGAGRGGTA